MNNNFQNIDIWKLLTYDDSISIGDLFGVGIVESEGSLGLRASLLAEVLSPEGAGGILDTCVIA
ncbi:hypothetical protein [Capsulimonas corticalis]|uniref:hypothetical protein n=1 Tax=Capsulimonas corticalis TaxID=2219043 RepID=UPI000F64DD5F|nr:hypothetical protein [Capsulimonas corticalis]